MDTDADLSITGASMDRNMPCRISAIVSTYNAERFIRGCLEDLESQTISDQIEIIIVNSGSEQNEGAIVKEFQKRYSNIKYIKTNQRETLYQAWNRGIKAATGKYITNANTDDRHKKDALEILAKTLDDHPAVGFAYADCLITEGENEIFELNTAKGCYIFPEFSVRQILARQFFGPQPIWRKSVHPKIGYFNPDYVVAGDYDFFIRLGWKYGGIHIPQFLGLYCKRSDSVERSNREINLKEGYEIKTFYRNVIPVEDIYPALKHCRDDSIAFAAAYADIGNFFIQIFNDLTAATKAYKKGLVYKPDSLELLSNLSVVYKLQGKLEKANEIWKHLKVDRDLLPHGSSLMKDFKPEGNKPENVVLLKIQHPIVNELTPVIPGSLEHSIQEGKYLQNNLKNQRQRKALANFNSALEKLRNSHFDLAADLMDNYRCLIDYELFEKLDQRSHKTPDVSVIIVAYNSNENLLHCLMSLEKQSYKNFEVIIIDNGKNEAVRSELEAQSLMLIKPPINLFPSEGRNIGANSARGKIIAFLDDDATAPENYVEEIIQAFEQYEIYGLRGKVLPKTDSKNNKIARHYDLGDIPIPAMINTEGNSAFLRKIYLAMEGMNPLLFGGEGMDLSYRMKKAYGDHKTIYFPGVKIIHDFADQSDKLNEKLKRHDFMEKYILWKHPGIHRWGSEAFKYASNKSLRIRGEKLIQKKFPLFSSSALSDQDERDRIKQIKFSIGIPTYNRADYLKDAIQSALNQNINNLEIVVVDDGSSDHTAEIIKQFNSRYIRYFKKKHEGAPSTRNRCIDQAKGDYIVWLDDDDILVSGLLEKYSKILDQDPSLDIIYGKVQYFDNATGNKLRLYDPVDWHANKKHVLRALLNGCVIPNPGTLVRKSLYEKYGNYDISFSRAHDYEFWTRAAKGARMRKADEIVAHYRVHDNNLSVGSFIDTSYESKIIRNLIKRYQLPEIFSDLSWENEAHTINAAHYMVAESIYKYHDYWNANDFLCKISAADMNTEILELLLKCNLAMGSLKSFYDGIAESNSLTDPQRRMINRFKARNKRYRQSVREAEKQIEDNRLLEARQIVKDILAVYGITAASMRLTAEILEKRGCPKEAFSYVKQAVLCSPDNTDLVNEAIANSSNAAEAKEIYDLRKRLLDDQNYSRIQGGNNVKPFEQMYQEIQPMIENQWYEAAINALEKLLEDYPRQAAAHNDLGALYYKAGQKEKALSHYRRAAQLEPQNVGVQRSLADFYYAELGQAEEALKIYENILAVAPHDVQTLLLTGHINVSLNRFDVAKDKYRRVLESEPWNADARQYLEALEKQGAGEAAAKTADALYAEIGPALNSGQPEAAIQALEKLSAAYPDFALAHNDLGVLYYNRGDKAKAQAHYERAAELEPRNMTFQKNLADFYFVECNRIQEAMDIYVKILEANPEDVETLLTAGHISVALQRFDDARMIYNRILEIEPWNADARQSLENVDNQESGSNPGGAIANLNPSLEADPRAHLTRG